jgi:transcriptional regulator with XRE-family HTH domain
MTKLGTRLAMAREAAGLSQSAAAVGIGVCRSALSRWERGTREPGLHLLGKLVKLYNTTFDELLGD